MQQQQNTTVGRDSILVKSMRPGNAHILKLCVHGNCFASRTQDAEVKKSLNMHFYLTIGDILQIPLILTHAQTKSNHILKKF